MNGVRRIVIFRSLSDGSVRLAITPGTVHPNPTSIGTMLRPESPSFRRSLSMIKATLAIYPLSSRSDRKKNSVTMIGRKLKTPPTPLKIPSITSECTTLFTCAAVVHGATFVSAVIPDSRSPAKCPDYIESKPEYNCHNSNKCRNSGIFSSQESIDLPTSEMFSALFRLDHRLTADVFYVSKPHLCN